MQNILAVTDYMKVLPVAEVPERETLDGWCLLRGPAFIRMLGRWGPITYLRVYWRQFQH